MDRTKRAKRYERLVREEGGTEGERMNVSPGCVGRVVVFAGPGRRAGYLEGRYRCAVCLCMTSRVLLRVESEEGGCLDLRVSRARSVLDGAGYHCKRER